MGRTIDERVVEMRFNNKDFEENAKDTINTLSKLRESLKLDGAVKGLSDIDKAAKNVSLDGIAAGVEFLQKRFSTMGIVGMQVIQNLTNNLMNLASKGINFVTDSIVSGGVKRAMNIENAHFQLQALLKDETKVQAVMADAMESVDGTAYAYDEAAKAASQFAASGLQSGEEMLGALKGITGVAAMTNSSFESISQIFTTVAGNGRLMGDQLLQLSSRGLNAASTLADYFKEVRGQANMTEGTIREMVTKGQLDFRTFADAMTWAFGDSAKRANETFTGAFSNMKSALARIGAGFISPLVEQNGVMVDLFNALRIKINDVKSALVFDEQTSAVRGLKEESALLDETYGKMLQNGTISMDNFVTAMFKAGNSEDVFGKKTDKVKNILTEFSESGQLTTEMLDNLNKFGTRSSDALRKFINGVQDGTIEASSSVKEMTKELSGGMTVLNSDIKKFAEEGKISYELYTAAMGSFTKSALDEFDGLENALKGMFAEVKEQGYVSSKTLEDFANNGMDAGKAILEYMQGVKNGTIRASYATKQSIEDMTDGVRINNMSLNKMIEEEKISYDIFQSAMENAYGKGEYASKKFTDAFQDMISEIKNSVENFDVSSFMEGAYYVFESFLNLGRGAVSVIKPIGEAMSEAFGRGTTGNVLDLARSLEKFTAKLRLSDKNSRDLKDTFTGLFSIVDLLVRGILRLLGVVVKTESPIGAMGDGILGVTGNLGRMLSAFSEWARSSSKIKRAFDITSKGIQTLISWFTKGVTWIFKFVNSIKEIPIVQRTFDKLEKKIISFGEVVFSKMDKAGETLEEFSKKIEDLIPKDFDFSFRSFSELLTNLNLSSPTEWFDKLTKAVENFFALIRKNEHVDKFVTNIETLWNLITKGFKQAKVEKDVDGITKSFDPFLTWIKDNFSAASLGGVLGALGGGGLIYAFIKIAKAIGSFGKTITSLPNAIVSVLSNLKGVLEAYQKNLNADTLLKLSKAIGLFAASLLVLSFIDPTRLFAAAIALGGVSWVLLGGITKLKEAITAGKKVLKPFENFVENLGNSISNFGVAAKKWATGNLVKSFGVTILEIAGSIIALGMFYSKDEAAFKAGSKAVLTIGGGIAAFMLISGIISKFMSVADIASLKVIGMVVKEMAFSLLIATAAIALLMNFDLPRDYESRLWILGGMIAAFTAVAVILNQSSKVLKGGEKLGSLLNPMISLAVFMTSVVYALKELMALQLPDDYKAKLGILGGIVVALGALAYTLNQSSKRIPEGNKQSKIASSMIAMAVFMYATVAALDKLMKMEFSDDWILKLGVLGGIVFALTKVAKSLGEAGAASGGKALKAAGSILALSVLLISIVGSLYVLSKIKVSGIAKSVAGLSVILLALKKTFEGIGSIAKGDPFKSVAALSLLILSLTASLAILSMIPFKSLAKSVVALSGTIYIISKTFEDVGKIGNGKNTWKSILALVAAIVSISISLSILANQPWQGLLAAAGSISAVMIALGGTLAIISKSSITSKSKGKLLALGEMLGGVIVIAAVLGVLANQPWQGLLAAAAGITSVMVALAGVMVVITKANIDPAVAAKAGLSFDAFTLVIGGFVGILGALEKLTKGGFSEILESGIAIMEKIGLAIGSFVGGILGGIAGGVIDAISTSLPNLGIGLSNFMVNLTPFLLGVKMIDDDVLTKIKSLCTAILLLTGAELLNGIATFLTGAMGMPMMGIQLSSFMTALQPFLNGVKNLDPASMEAVKWLAEAIILLTGADLLNGIKNFFGMDSGGLSQFADELSAMGPAIAQFSNDVKGIDAGAVESAASAIEIMANAASKLQGTGGYLQKIVGEKSLGDFAIQLAAMGPGLRMFATWVKGIDATAVEGAASAISMMADAAENLPPQDGWVQKIFGSKSLSDFASELASAAPNLVNFANQMATINPASLIGTITVTSIMRQITDNMPETDTLWEKIFGGGKTNLVDLANDLNEFAEGMVTFSETAAGINIISITGAISSFQSLLDLANGMGDTTADGIVNFANSLGQIGTDCVNNFVSAFSNSGEQVAGAMGMFLLTITTAILTYGPNFIVAGQQSLTFYLSGISLLYPSCMVTGMTVAAQVVSGIQFRYPDFLKAGNISADNYLTGIRSRYSMAISTGKTLASSVINGITSNNSAFNTAGQNAGNGFVEGLRSKIKDAEAAGAALGKAAADAAKKALDEHSPSKVMGKIGDNAGLGFVLKLRSYVSEAFGVGQDIGGSTADGIKLGVDDLRNIFLSMGDPTIRPVMDLSGLRGSMDEVQAMFNDAIFETSLNFDKVSAMMNYRTRGTEGERSGIQNGETVQQNYTFNQYNTSPKALSRIDIYRNTKNQFSQFKEATKK